QLNAQWALRNTGQNGGQYGSDINAATAWQTTTGSSATIIAVIDSGIDFTHPDLTNNQWTNPIPQTLVICTVGISLQTVAKSRMSRDMALRSPASLPPRVTILWESQA